MKYFLPENDDKVDGQYDFIRDKHSRLHKLNPESNDSYIWNIYDAKDVPFDGILISRMTMKNNRTKTNQILEKGAHTVLNLPRKIEIMGDCGAFGYIEENEPPFKSKDTLEYYIKCGFKYGTSIDHLVVPAFESENKKRWKITLENAREMYSLWKSRDRFYNSIRLIGVAQGWDRSSYTAAVNELLSIGYDYVALGGLVRSPSGITTVGHMEYNQGNAKTVLNVVSGASAEIKKWERKGKRKVDLHIFGVARDNILSAFHELGVTSFDSASFLRRAWLGSDNNYLTTEGKSYGALRIPQVEKSRITRNHKSKKKFNILEKNALELCRKFDTQGRKMKDAIEAITAYDIAIGEKRNFALHYKKTLAEKPWKKCPCRICNELGIEVMIFRGNNRNRRRGFHNTYAFYQRFRKMYPKIIAFTFCTATKNLDKQLLPAYLRYGASRNMRTFWSNVCDLPIDIGMFSAKFGLIDWHTPIPNYDHKLNEDDKQMFIDSIGEKLHGYDKVFFIGLSGYRKVVESIKEQFNYDIEIFPKSELAVSNGRTRSLDIIEYAKQMKNFRSKILENIPHFDSDKQSITIDNFF